MYYRRWAPYVSVAERRRKANRQMARLRQKGIDTQPVEIDGRTIAKKFWGKAWCEHMESLGDYSNRLPRGRTYVRNGSVCHLAIAKGEVTAKVSGSEIYDVKVRIGQLAAAKWKKVKSHCAGQVGSLLELLQGKLSDSVMQIVTDRQGGLFPNAKEIRLNCSCPDWAIMCKHVAAVLYGVGARLDEQPELLFLLRGVNHEELVTAAAIDVFKGSSGRRDRRQTLAASQLSDVFGIDVDAESEDAAASAPAKRKKRKASSGDNGIPKSNKKKVKKAVNQKAANASSRDSKISRPNKKKVKKAVNQKAANASTSATDATSPRKLTTTTKKKKKKKAVRRKVTTKRSTKVKTATSVAGKRPPTPAKASAATTKRKKTKSSRQARSSQG